MIRSQAGVAVLVTAWLLCPWSGAATGPATAPATKPAATQTAKARAVAQPFDEKADYEKQRKSIAGMKDLGHFKINDLLNATLENGILKVDPIVIYNTVHGEGRIEVDNPRDPTAAKLTWRIGVQVFPGDINGPQNFLNLSCYDWDQEVSGQICAVSINDSPNLLLVSAMGHGISITYEQTGPAAARFVALTIRAGDGKNRTEQGLLAPTLLQLEAEHPQEVRKYLTPLLTRLTGKKLLEPGPSDLYSVFHDIPADPKTTQAVTALLPRLDADAEADRDAASADLAKLGAPGILAVLRLDRSTLTQQQKSRCDAFVQSERHQTIDDPDEALHDVTFLLEAADADDPAVRIAAKKDLEALVGHPLDFDPSLEGEARFAAVDKMDKAIRHEMEAKESPAEPAPGPATMEIKGDTAVHPQ
jgi:hypothetical protein